MSDLLALAIAGIFVMTIVLLIARKFKISSRYERAPRELNSWVALDKGFDPTEEQKL
jgi:hypothetical protein